MLNPAAINTSIPCQYGVTAPGHRPTSPQSTSATTSAAMETIIVNLSPRAVEMRPTNGNVSMAATKAAPSAKDVSSSVPPMSTVTKYGAATTTALKPNQNNTWLPT